MLKRTLITLLIALMLAFSVVTVSAQEEGDTSPEAQAIVTLVAASEQFYDITSEHPDFSYFAVREDDVWFVELYVDNGEEDFWIGEAIVNAETLEIIEAHVGDDEPHVNSPEGQAAIDHVVATDAFMRLARQFPVYEGFAYEDGEFFFIEFIAQDDEGEEVFLGEVVVRRETLEIEEYHIAVFLTPEEIEAQRPEILALAEANPAVMELLADLPPQQPYIEYMPLDQAWVVIYEYGLDVYQVIIAESEDSERPGLVVQAIENVREFDDAQMERIMRDRAISVAFEADVFAEMDLPEAWFTRVSPLGEGLVGVDFVAEDGSQLVQVIVDMRRETVVEVSGNG